VALAASRKLYGNATSAASSKDLRDICGWADMSPPVPRDVNVAFPPLAEVAGVRFGAAPGSAADEGRRSHCGIAGDPRSTAIVARPITDAHRALSVRSYRAKEDLLRSRMADATAVDADDLARELETIEGHLAVLEAGEEPRG